MRSVLLCLVVLLSLAHLSSAGGIQSVTLWNDSSCSTLPINVATQFNLTETSQWPTLSSTAVSSTQGAPQCANVSLNAVSSGTYTCVNSGTGGWGLQVEEFNVSGCAGNPSVLYEFFGAPNSNCTNGNLEIVSGPYTGTYALWATVVCSAVGSSSSSTAAPVASSSSSSTASPSAFVTSSSPSSSSAAGGAIAQSSSSSIGSVSSTGPAINGAGERMSVATAVLATALLSMFVTM